MLSVLVVVAFIAKEGETDSSFINNGVLSTLTDVLTPKHFNIQQCRYHVNTHATVVPGAVTSTT